MNSIRKIRNVGTVDLIICLSILVGAALSALPAPARTVAKRGRPDDDSSSDGDGVVEEEPLCPRNRIRPRHHGLGTWPIRQPVQPVQPVLSGWTPLYNAAYEGNKGAAGALINAGADMSKCTPVCGSHMHSGAFPLYTASFLGHAGVVELLLTAKAAVDQQKINFGGATALYAACMNGHLNCVKLLVDANADPTKSRKDVVGNNPLFAAEATNHTEICAVLRAAVYGGAGEAM